MFSTRFGLSSVASKRSGRGRVDSEENDTESTRNDNEARAATEHDCERASLARSSRSIRCGVTSIARVVRCGTRLAGWAGVHTSSDSRELPDSPTKVHDAELHAAERMDRIDVTRSDSLHFTAPVADWIEFLAELLAAELLRERAGGGHGR
jgi:hypothetical protein